MDAATAQQIRLHWPDLFTPFEEITPAGCVLVALRDDWNAGDNSRRLRVIELIPAENCPPVQELIEEVAGDAFREGWTPQDEAEVCREFELEGVILRIETARQTLHGTDHVTLQLSFDQPWPSDAGAPVETSELFQDLVRKRLRLGEDPFFLSKAIVVDASRDMRAQSVRECVRLGCPENLLPQFEALGFVPPPQAGGAWQAEELTEVYRVVASVRKREDVAEVLMMRTRLTSAPAP